MLKSIVNIANKRIRDIITQRFQNIILKYNQNLDKYLNIIIKSIDFHFSVINKR
ncbi:hypothetical protein [Candidatus Providencia siddallii]|uniref:hypothetical protein n=1 Tax=Candidatus Providencia siddallii TaxID=1715285 RepID=UPI00312CBB3B